MKYDSQELEQYNKEKVRIAIGSIDNLNFLCLVYLQAGSAELIANSLDVVELLAKTERFSKTFPTILDKAYKGKLSCKLVEGSQDIKEEVLHTIAIIAMHGSFKVLRQITLVHNRLCRSDKNH